jgi:hypothetical protein
MSLRLQRHGYRSRQPRIGAVVLNGFDCAHRFAEKLNIGLFQFFAGHDPACTPAALNKGTMPEIRP